MAMDVSTLVVKVESKGIDNTTKSLDNLTKSAETAEKYVQNLMDRMGKSSQAVNAVVSSMNQLRAAMNGAIPTNTISAATAEFKKMSDELRKITDAMGKGVGKGVTVNIHEIGTSSKEAVKGVESLNQSLAKGQNVFQAFGKELYHIRNLLGGTMLAHAMIEAAKAAITLADAWTLANAKLAIFVGSATMAAHAQERLFVVAQDLRVPMESVTTLFTRLVPAMKEYGYNTESAMQVTRSMAAALQISGATTAEISSVMLQFSQAMAAGRLNGAEFNAVAEGAPIVLRALSEALGVSRGALKKMAADGLLPTTVLTEVLKGKMEEWEAQQKSLPLTVGKAWTLLTDSFSRFIGKMNEGTGVTGLIAKSIKLIGDNLQNITNIIGVGIVAWGSYSAAMMVYNMWLTRSVALNASLATSLGITTVATTAAAGATGTLSAAMAFLMANPVVLTLTAIAAAMAAIYLWTDKAKNAQQDFSEKDAAGDKAGAMNVLAKEVERSATQYNNLAMEMARINKERAIAQQLGAGTSSQVAQLNALQQQLVKVSKGYADALKALQDYKQEQERETIKQGNEELTNRIAILRKEVSIKRNLTSAEKELDSITSKRDALGARTAKNEELFKAYDKNVEDLNEIIRLEKIRKDQDASSKKETKSGEPFDKKYMKMVESIKLFIANQEEELGLRRKLTAAEKEAVKIEEFIANNRSKMTNAEVVAMNATKQRILHLGEQQIAQEKINKDLDEYYERIVQIGDEESKKSNDYFKVKEDSLQKTRVLLAEVNGVELSSLSNAMAASEADKRKIKQLNDQISKVWELKEAKAEAAYIDAEMSGDTAGADRAAKALKAIQDRIKGIKDQIKLTEMENAELDKQLDLMFKISQIKMTEIGRTPGAILADGFGEAGKAIGGMVDAYDDFGKQAKQINTELQAQLEYLAKKGASPEVIAKAEQAAAEKRVQINAQMYGNMASSAKGFFSEQSKGYKALEKAEKAFRTIELALAIKNNAQKLFLMGEELAMFIFNSTKALAVAIETSMASATAAAPAAVANAAIQPGPLAFVGAAAMIALLAGLGIAVAGGGSGGGNANISTERQSAAGTGTVFGDSTAKSESVSKSLELVAENTSISAKYNEGMLASLRNIENGFKGVSNLFIRSGIQAKVGSADVMGSQKMTMANYGAIGKILSVYLMPFDKLAGALFSSKQSVVDSGIVHPSQTLGEITDGGLEAFGYTTIETKKKRWGKTKVSAEENLSDLDEMLKNQLKSTITGIGDAVSEAAKLLGVNGEDFTAKLNSFTVDLGHISLQGLSGEKIREQFATVFSKLGDEMALAAIPGLDSYQEVGEGYLETLIRVASTVATVDGIFDSIGQTLGAVGIEGADAKMNLVELAGGLQELNGLVQDFYNNFYTEAERNAITVQNLKEQFAALKIPMIDLSKESARIDFRNLVNSYKDTNSEVYLALLKLAPVVASLAPEVEEAVNKVSKATELNDRLLELTGQKTQLVALQRERELATLDDTSVELQRRVWALEDENKASQEALELSKKRQDIELKILSLTDPIAYTVALRQKELASLDESLKPLQERVWALEDEKAAINLQIAAINLQITAQDSLVDSITQSLNAVDDLIGSVDSLSEAGRGLVGLSPKTKTLIESFNDTEAQINSLSETLNTFSGTTALSVTESLAALIEQGKGMSDFQNSLTDSIASLRFESMSLEDRLSSLRAKERKLFSEITSSEDPLTVAKNLQDTINARYSLEKEYQDNLISGQQEINNTSKDAIKQQIDALKNTRDLLGEIRSFTYDLRIGDSSVLSPQKQLEVASQQFYEVLAKAQAGDTKAQSSITSVAKTFLDEAKGYYASTTGYVNIFNQVMGALSGFGTTEVIDPQLAVLERQLTALDSLNISTIDLREQQAIDLEKVGTTLSGLQAENRAKQEELVQSLKDQIAELKAVQANQVAQIKQQLAIRDETNALLNDAKTKLTDMRDSLKLLERK